jgi:spore maturation protein CgeB
LDALLVETARRLPKRRFVVAGPLYPEDAAWPPNVERFEHVPPPAHRDFYCSQTFTLNLTRAEMKAAGHSPSVRLFEAAACGSAIVSDRWAGLSELFVPGKEILLADSTAEVVRLLTELRPEAVRAVGQRALRRVLASHTAAHRAEALERDVAEAREHQPARAMSTRQVRRARVPQRSL